MKALTIWQPWAGLIMAGVKPVENRTWSPRLALGDRFAIHAGKAVGVEEWVEPFIYENALRVSFESGYIIGTVRYMGIIAKPEQLPLDKQKWFVGPVGWLLDDPHIWSDAPEIKGALGLWEVPQSLVKV